MLSGKLFLKRMQKISKEPIIEHKNSWVWMIDPLDGTKDFIQKLANMIHVALLHNNKPVLGMVCYQDLKKYGLE